MTPEILSTKRERGDISPRIIETLITESSNKMQINEIGRIYGIASSSSYELMFPLFVEQKNLEVKLSCLKTLGIEGILIDQRQQHQTRKFCEIEFNDGSKYDGDLRAGKPHGLGTLQLFNGDKYTGQWRDGYKEGTGIYLFASGAKHTGKWYNDLRHGHGQTKFTNGDILEGNFYQGMIHGKGKLIYRAGSIYKGYFQENKI